MKIYSWNVNGLRAVMTKNFGSFLESEKPDILCLQETRISADMCDKIELPFKYKYFSCADKKGYSGTAILSNIEPKSGGAVDLEGDHPNEGRITEADFGKFTLISAYVPNSQPELARLDYRCKWNKHFLELVQKRKNVLVCGDLNVAHNEIDLARPDDNHLSAGFSDQEREDFTTLLEKAPLVDLWRERNPDTADKYTWWSYRGGARSRNVGWRIDYFLSSPSLAKKIKSVEIHDKILGSDHCPVSIELE